MKKILILFTFFLATAAQADSFYCSSKGGNGYINTGDTMQQVQATCGNPTSASQQQTSNVMQEQIQVWIYAPRVINNNNNNSIYNTQLNTNNNTPSVAFQVINNQVTAINSSVQGQTQQWRCPNGIISIGASATQLSNACGQPTTMDNNSQQVSVQPHNIVYWSYQVNQYSKPTIMKFQDGYLVGVTQ
ncbi:MAG: DUF2845 domain-containing protein [Gammaproteobacteria bacterium]